MKTSEEISRCSTYTTTSGDEGGKNKKGLREERSAEELHTEQRLKNMEVPSGTKKGSSEWRQRKTISGSLKEPFKRGFFREPFP